MSDIRKKSLYLISFLSLLNYLQCLVHADLRCSNILMLEDEVEQMRYPSQRSGDRRSRAFKGT